MAITPPSAPFRGGKTDAWTPRQREVLDLLVRGRTNGQIATELGISLDGAKWHVSEIITKLGVDSREEAAEYWRAQNGLRLRFTRAVRALIPTGAWAKIAAGGLTLAVAGIAVAAVVAALQNAGEDDTRAAVSPAATTQATPSPDAATPSATQPPPPGSEVIDGVTVQPMSLGANVSFPRNVLLYYIVAHYQTDGGGPLMRMYADDLGRLHSDEVFASLKPLGKIYTTSGNLDRQEFFAGVCTKGDCGGGFSWAEGDSQNTLYHSIDGAVTWTELGSLPRNAFLAAATADGIVVTTYDTDGTGNRHYSMFPSGEAVVPPVDGATPAAVEGDGLVWLDGDTGRWLSADGSQILWQSPASGLNQSMFHSRDGVRFVSWQPITRKPYTEQPFNHYFGVLRNGKLQNAFSIPGNVSVNAHAALSSTLLIGNVGLTAGGQLAQNDLEYVRVAVIDLTTGQIHPIPEASAGLASPGGPANEHAFVSGATTGTFARVSTGGDCLNVREQPATTATSLACFKDGVLLRLGAEPERADGATTWLSVSTPDGRLGWASAEFLQR